MDKTLLAKYLLSFFHASIPISNHSYYEKPQITEERYQSIAETIAEASMESPLFSDDDGLKTALILGSIATYESSLRDNVDTCKLGGDNNQAWSIWQMHKPKSQVCERRIDAARQAREMVRESFRVCKSYDLMDRLSLYTDGRCEKSWKRSSSRMYRAMNFAKVHPPLFEEVASE